MNQKTLWVICGSLFVAAFLLGFVPQYLKGCRNLDHQLDSARLEHLIRKPLAKENLWMHPND